MKSSLTQKERGSWLVDLRLVETATLPGCRRRYSG